MPRRPSRTTGGLLFHVLNRAVEGLVLFEDAVDYVTFLETLRGALDRFRVELVAYALMPNHWHLVLRPLDDSSLSPFMQWLTARQAEYLRKSRDSRGRGAVYQGRYKAVAVQEDGHFLRLCRYVERNPLRSRLVARAEDWPWSSASPSALGGDRPVVAPWPLTKPANWLDLLNTPEAPRSLNEVRRAVRLGRHFGAASWRLATNARLRWTSGLSDRGRPTYQSAVPIETGRTTVL